MTEPPRITERPQPARNRFGGSPLTPSSAKRIAAFGSLVVVLFGILVVRLWFLQVVGARDFEAQAVGNSIRTINIPAPRGRILDRNGVELAGTREAWDIVALPQDLEDENGRLSESGSETLGRIARAIGEPKAKLRRLMVLGKKRADGKSVVFKADIDDELRVPLMERLAQFPGIRIEKTFRRDYPQKSSLGHVLGWVGPITEETIDERRRQGYRNDAIVGQWGLELRYEEYLRGVDGERRVEVDAAGQPVAQSGRGSERPARPGLDLQTSIDLNVQRTLEDALRVQVELKSSPKDAAGAGGVVMDPETGEVIAMASYPPIDPRVYSRGRRREVLEFRRNPRKPELFRPLWAYPPASTFKPLTAIAALNAGYLRPDEFLTSRKNVKLFGQVFRNFRELDQDDMSVRRALAVSSDTFFYQVGATIYSRADKISRDAGDNKLRQWSAALGLGAQTGIDLPGEFAGVVPDRTWKATNLTAKDVTARDARFIDKWVPGDTINMSIGQGLLKATPLQMARAYGSLVNTGRRVVTPRIGKLVVDATTGDTVLDVRTGRRETVLPPIRDEVIAPVLGGLFDATNTFEGTAAPVFGRFGGLVAGKTGTAETGRNRDHAWFVGYGPAGASARTEGKYVVAVVVEYAGLGGEVAAPAACRALTVALNADPERCGNGRRAPQEKVAD